MTIQFVAFCAGLFLVIVAIFGGGIEIKEVKVANLGTAPRVLSFILGCGLLAVYFTGRLPAENTVEAEPPGKRPGEIKIAEGDTTRNQPHFEEQLSHAEQQLAEAKEELKTASGQVKQQQYALNNAIAALNSARAEAERTSIDAKSREEKVRAEIASKEAERAQEKAKKDLELQRQLLKEAENKLIEKSYMADKAQENVDSDVKDAAYQTAARLPVIGYVMFAVIDKLNKPRKVYFSIEGKPEARFPGPNDVIEPIITAERDKVAIRGLPFHWSNTKGDSVHEGEVLAYIRRGQKAKVAGDVFVSTDPHNGEQYAIVPIAQTLNFQFDPGHSSVFQVERGSPGIQGYVYIGRIDDQTGEFVEKRFENETRHNAIYPAPNDRLRAIGDSNLRSGPRYWDTAKARYVNSPIVGEIKGGDFVVSAGDAILAKEGQTVWVPVTR